MASPSYPATTATVVHSDGTRDAIRFDRILDRVRGESYELSGVDPVHVARRVVQGVHDGVTTRALDTLAAETAASLASQHPDYSVLAARIALTRLHKETSASVACILSHLSLEVRRFAEAHLAALDAAFVWTRDFAYDYFGYRTLLRSYLLRDPVTDAVVERPQTMLMRVSLGIHCGDLEAVLETYDHLSRGVFTHATPTMFHAGTPFPHLASCFLLPVASDSIEGIFETNKTCALISKSGGGIGFSISNVRGTGARIHSTGGTSTGLVPMLRCFESTARYVDQGGGKRRGAFAAYLEPWHPDVRVFLDMKKNHGVEEMRARDLFYALWIPDLFMRRVEANAHWTLLCPSAYPGLVDVHGAAFDALYESYEEAASARATADDATAVRVRAQDLWFAILDAQIETGTPFMLYKDACNAKSNHSHLGTIRSSNLCTEIVQYSAPDEIAVCNLASVALPRFVDSNSQFDHAALGRAVGIVTRNLNRVVDRNLYACAEARDSNLRHRPLGIGVQGLADVFAMLEYPFEGPEARVLNRDIFETLYYAALDASCALAERHGAYASYVDSPASRGQLQMDMWDRAPPPSGRWDWEALRARIRTFGLRNSLLVAPMPTASTAQILGNNECFEPFTSNVYVRRVLAGEFPVVNRHLVRALERRGLWSETMRQRIVAANGSVKDIDDIPDDVRAVFRTAWEMSMRSIIDMAADRAVYVDQSMSMNAFVAEPTHQRLTSMHFHAWRSGLKTGMYYLRTRASADAVKVTIPPALVAAAAKDEEDQTAAAHARNDGPGECLLCSA